MKDITTVKFPIAAALYIPMSSDWQSAELWRGRWIRTIMSADNIWTQAETAVMLFQTARRALTGQLGEGVIFSPKPTVGPPQETESF